MILLFWLMTLLLFSNSFLESFNNFLSLYHLFEFSNVLRELRKLLIFSISDLNIFKVNLFLIFGHLKFHQVMSDKFFVCLLKSLYVNRVATEVATEFLELGFNLLVKLISLCD